ncbi:MAG TPA: M23 family metallopeptidase [Vicingus sp.]|nr:M23 family metallopeptidase [Vicingus sp.]
MIRTLILLLFLCSAFYGFSQQSTNYPKDYFRSPLDIPLLLSGNFGELRNNHFHSGLDIKTQGAEGKNVYAIADGYVSRIRVMPNGYGKIIYIDHPNGYTSTYAHLQQFKGKIAEEVKRYQYEKESFELDYFPPDTLLRVKKGEIIALSGNSGSSGGPHLHFEIRETATEFAINPMLFGFDIKDNIAPVIRSISVFPLNDTSFVNNRNVTQEFNAIKSNGNYQVLSSISAYGLIGVGINSYDQQSGASNQNGTYSVMLFENNELIYKTELSSFHFNHNRAMNSFIDYELYHRTKKRYQRSYIEPNNPLTVYKEHKNNGVISVKNGETKTMNFILGDLNKNTSLLSFTIHGKKPELIETATIRAKVDTILNCFIENIVDKHNIKVTFPKGVLYSDLHLQYQEKPALRNSLTPVYQIHNGYTPIHDVIEVSIKPGRITEEQRKKAVIVNIDQNGTYFSRGGEWRNNYLTAKSKILGGFTVMTDTIAPHINPVNIYPNKNMYANWSISVTISDNLSGIKTYRGEIDGKWILMDYDAKSAKLTHVFDNLPSGNHVFKLEVTDFVDNKKVVEIPFIR